MKKIDLGQTMGILANLGVLIGILLLVYELAQNREVLRSQTRQSVAELLTNLLAMESTDALLPEIQVKQLSGETLTPVERYRLAGFTEAYWRYRESVYFQYRNGLYDEEEYLSLRSVWLREIETEKWYRDHYCRRRSRSPSDLTAEIDSLMTNPCE